MRIVWFLIVGAIAGWLAGVIFKGRGFGVLGNIVVGVIGALLGGYLLGALGVYLGGGLLGAIGTALAGALVLLALASALRKV
jgi:uncharacterized membrane protein YeaQ/YmgE (transglycosylase-associated protein family)